MYKTQGPNHSFATAPRASWPAAILSCWHLHLLCCFCIVAGGPVGGVGGHSFCPMDRSSIKGQVAQLRRCQTQVKVVHSPVQGSWGMKDFMLPKTQTQIRWVAAPLMPLMVLFLLLIPHFYFPSSQLVPCAHSSLPVAPVLSFQTTALLHSSAHC